MPFAKCNCKHCGGHIEFPVEMAGQTSACPHCHLETLLIIPPAAVPPSQHEPASKDTNMIGLAMNTKLKVAMGLLVVALVVAFAIWKFERDKGIARFETGEGDSEASP